LAGNHEIEMLAAFSDPATARPWLDLGGIETLRSYGVSLASYPRSGREVKAVMLMAASVVPQEHLDFLRGLPVAAMWHQYVFVHAGCTPGVSIREQRESDLVTIREPFLSAWGNGDTIVVHGHTPAAEPRQMGSRIQVDTACYATGRLSAARITTSAVQFISTGDDS
jgi:serine/threonine protein phosphatase 1